MNNYHRRLATPEELKIIGRILNSPDFHKQLDRADYEFRQGIGEVYGPNKMPSPYGLEQLSPAEGAAVSRAINSEAWNAGLQEAKDDFEAGRGVVLDAGDRPRRITLLDLE